MISAQTPSQQGLQEDDWWLPKWVKPLPSVVSFYGAPPFKIQHQDTQLVTIRWRDLEPQENVYNWSKIQNALAQGKTIYLRMETSDVLHVPDWVKEKYPDLGIIRRDPYTDNFEEHSEGIFYRVWHTGFTRELKDLLDAFATENFASDPHFKFMYIPGAWEWGEFDVSGIRQMEADGLTPQTFLSWWRNLVDTYVATVGMDNAHKLMYTGGDAIGLVDGNIEWRYTLGRSVSRYVINQGASVRFGLLEKFNFAATDLPNYGTTLVSRDGAKYMVTDDSAPLLSNPQRLIGSENEELGNSNIPWKNYYQLKMTVLKSLQLRVNQVFTNRDVWQSAPELHQYLLKTLGKTVDTSPDAWVALREGKDLYQYWAHYDQGVQENDYWVRNFERWLVQREVKRDGQTVRTYRVKNSPVLFNQDSFEARRTNHDAGSDYIYFDVNDQFIYGGKNHVLVKVTYLDNFAGSWHLDYGATQGRDYQSTQLIENKNDKTWKTVTFKIQDAAFVNQQRQGMDFRIYNGGEHDITVRFVRLIKMDPPSTLERSGYDRLTGQKESDSLVGEQSDAEDRGWHQGEIPNIFEGDRSDLPQNFQQQLEELDSTVFGCCQNGSASIPFIFSNDLYRENRTNALEVLPFSPLGCVH